MSAISKSVTGLLVLWALPLVAQSSASGGFRNAAPMEFAGEWQVMSADETSGELVELEVSGESIQGMIVVVSRGAISGRTTIESQVSVTGRYRAGGFDVALRDTQGAELSAALRLRGEFLILLVDGQETSGYGRPGRSLVDSADADPQAAVLAGRIRGKVFSTGRQVEGRGAFVGGRLTVSFCFDGSISYARSELASTPGAAPGAGVDMGSTFSRRGRWSVVLYAGVPAVRADWQGTGTSYSLVAYLRVVPSADGRSATVDGMRLPVTGNC